MPDADAPAALRAALASRPRPASAAEAAGLVGALVAGGQAELPVPGGGATVARFEALAVVAGFDLSTARLLEGHVDATAILAEAAAHRAPGATYGVWAAEAPPHRVTATPAGGGRWVLEGTKRWCSGATGIDRALLTATTADGERLLVDLDLISPGVVPVPGSWPALGMAWSDSGDVRLDGVEVEGDTVVGDPGWYLRRPGFWHGAVGVAACWYGGARAVAEVLRRRSAERVDDEVAAVHLGAVAAAGAAMASTLVAAAAAIDADPLDRRGGARRRAEQVRHVVERGCSAVLDRVGRATGAGPLALDPDHARRVADLGLYLRQHHAEHDLAGLGALVAGGVGPTFPSLDGRPA